MTTNEGVLCIGLMGQLGSGKSTVAAFFKELGVEVISADDIAKKLTTKTQPAYHEIIKHFGSSIQAQNGELDRRELRDLIFKDKTQRLWLENLLHPLIRAEIERKISKIDSPYCVIEIPLLLDRKTYPYLRRVLLIQADTEQQITRCMQRDNSTREDILAILAIQADKQKQREFADDILVNKGSLAELGEKVRALHDKYAHNIY